MPLDVRLPIMVGLGQDNDHALDLFLKREVGAGGKQEAIAVTARVNILDDDGGTKPCRHFARVAGHGDPARFRRLSLKPGRLIDTADDLLDGFHVSS